MGQTTKQKLVKQAKDQLAIYQAETQKYECICTFLCRKDISPLEAKEAEEASKFALINSKRAITNYYQKLIQIGKIRTEEELEASIKRFAPAKYIHKDMVIHTLKKQKA